MAVKVGAFTVDSALTAGQTQAITGVGFTPDCVIFHAINLNNSLVDQGPSGGSHSTSFGWMLTNGKEACVVQGIQDAADPYGARSGIYNNRALMKLQHNGTNNGQFSFSSMDSDGFTIYIDTSFNADHDVRYIAISGKTFNQIEVTEPASTGQVAYTGAGFQPTFMLALTDHASSFGSIHTDARWGIGAAIDTGEQEAHWTKFEAHGLGSADHAVACGNDEVIVQMNGGTNSAPNARATLVQFDSDGFTLDWLERASTGRLSVCLVSDGNWWVDGDTFNSGSDRTLSGFTWAPEGLILISAEQAEDAPNASNTVDGSGGDNGGFSVGFATSDTEQSCGYSRGTSDGLTGASRCDKWIEYDQIALASTSANPSAATERASVKQAFDSDSIVIQQDAGSSGAFLFYIAIGPPIVDYRSRLNRYLHNTYQSLKAGRAIFRDLVGRDVPPHQLEVDEWCFSGGIGWPSPVKYENKLQDPNAFYFESLKPTDEKVSVETDRESFFESIMRRLGRG